MLPTVPHDKSLHVIYGSVIALVALALATFAHLPLPPIWALVASALVGGLKEVYDRKSGKGTVDPLDCWATIAGGVIVMLAGWL